LSHFETSVGFGLAFTAFRWTRSCFLISLSHVGSFYTDVISQDPRCDSLARVAAPALLEPTTRQRVEGIVHAAQQMGIEVMVYETYRSQASRHSLTTAPQNFERWAFIITAWRAT
jgi:hypothetical protein